MISEVIGLHATGRSFLTVWLENTAEKAPLRPGRRMSYIEPMVDALKKQLTPAARKRLKQALAMVMGTEALIAVRDIGQYGALAFTDAARFKNLELDIAGDNLTMPEAARSGPRREEDIRRRTCPMS